MKREIIGICLTAALTASGTGCTFAEKTADGIKVIYDGSEIEFDVEPEIIDDRVMVPMRAVFEAFGAKVKWDGGTQTITAKKKSKTIEMTIGSAEMKKNDETYSFDISPVIEDGRTLVPIRALSDLLGLEVNWDGEEQVVEIFTPSEEAEDLWKENTGTINLDTMEVTGEGISVSSDVITISEGGDFEITGALENGQIVVDSEDKVKLRLSGMSLTNKSGSAIYIKNADKAYITLTENTENTLTDGESYAGGDENEKACITARDNLEIKGSGSLTVNGNSNHGIDGSDSIEIGNGNITINAKNDGIHANETLAINGGTLNVTAGGDGIQADEIIDITGGTVNIKTTGEIPASENNNFGGRFENGGNMEKPQQMTDEERQSMREEMRKQIETVQLTEEDADSDEDAKSKGIKAGWMLDISGGEITVNSTDHAIHCTSDLNIKGGRITLASEVKKGISAHGNIVIDNGEIDITKSTEGIETKQIMTINGGDINIVASDDGLNAGGSDFDEMGGFGAGENTRGDRRSRGEMTPPEEQNGGEMSRPEMPDGGEMTPPEMQNGGEMSRPEMPDGGEMTPPEEQNGGEMSRPENGNGGRGGFGSRTESDEQDSNHHIQINGGNITITADNDGIDSNGSLFIEGGNIFVNAQVSGAESAFDTDGAMLFNGGTIIGVSGTGLDESPSSYSKQNVILCYTTSMISAGENITVKNSKGDTVFDFTPSKGGNKIVISSEEIETGETYTVYAGDEQLSGAVEGVITTIGEKQQRGFSGMTDRGNKSKME